MDGVKTIICGYCKKPCGREFQGELWMIGCDCNEPHQMGSVILPTAHPEMDESSEQRERENE